MRPFLILLPVLALAAGCSKGPPTMAGGKSVRHWLEALHDPSPGIRRTAVVKLGNVGTADPAAVPALLDALQDSDARVRYEAIVALLKYDAAARQCLPTFRDLTQRDPDASVRQCALRAIERLEGGAAP